MTKRAKRRGLATDKDSRTGPVSGSLVDPLLARRQVDRDGKRPA